MQSYNHLHNRIVVVCYALILADDRQIRTIVHGPSMRITGFLWEHTPGFRLQSIEVNSFLE